MTCEQANCSREATSVIYWPGKTIICCDGCTERARRVADAMGFLLTVQPMEPCLPDGQGRAPT